MDKSKSQGVGGGAIPEDIAEEEDVRLVIDEGSSPKEDKLQKRRKKSPVKAKSPSSKVDHSTQQAENLYTCPTCEKTFRRKVKLQSHLLTHKSKEELGCENCGRKFRKVDSLFSHSCPGSSNNYKCSDCGEWFRLKKDLISHQQVHKKVFTIDIPWDDKDSSEECDFSSFVASYVKWPVACIHCGAELINLQNYNVHMATHKGGGPCVCSVCETNFSCRDDYLLHKDICQIDRTFDCTHCEEKFATQSSLDRHLQTHTVKGMSCDMCGLSFNQRNKLISHMKLHTKKEFACTKCKKIFQCKKSLLNHNCSSQEYNNEDNISDVFVDKDGKSLSDDLQDSFSVVEGSDSEDTELCQVVSESYFCQVCEESFDKRQALITHLTTHYRCTDCKKFFKSQADLDMHLFLLGEEKLYSCCLCEAVLHGKKELEYHLSLHVASDDPLLEDLGLEEATSDPVEGTGLSVKIHKVTPAGTNSVKCSDCGKLVPLHHNLAAHMRTSTPVPDSGEEYVYISRLGNPQSILDQTDSHCSCHQSSGNVLNRTGEMRRSQYMNTLYDEHEDQESQKTKTSSPTRSHTYKLTINRSSESKCKVFLNDVMMDSRIQTNVNGNKVCEREELCTVEVVSPGAGAGQASALSSSFELPENYIEINSPSHMSDCNVPQIACKNRSISLKLHSNTSEVEVAREASHISSTSMTTVEDDEIRSKPSRAGAKELAFGSNTESFSRSELKIQASNKNSELNSSRSFNDSTEDVMGLENEASKANLVGYVSKAKNTNAKMKVNLMIRRQDEDSSDYSVSASKLRSAVKRSSDSAVSKSAKIKVEKSSRKASPSKTNRRKKRKPLASRLNTYTSKVYKNKIITEKCKSRAIKTENRIERDNVLELIQQELSTSGSNSGTSKVSISGNNLPVIQPKVPISNKRTTPPARGSELSKASQTRASNEGSSDCDVLSVDLDESCCIPAGNMVFKVEKLGYDSDDDSLEFGGIKKEYLNADAFIKEEWDIVDF